MAFIQNSVLTKYINSLNKDEVNQQWQLFKQHFHNPAIQENIRNSKEEQYQGEFLIDLFVNILGYTKSPTPNFNLTTEYKNIKDSKKADGAIIINEKAIAVIELKGTETTDLSRIETQAFGYKNNQPDCVYVITSNFEKLRFYIDNAIDHLEFNLFTLSEKEFQLLYVCLAFSQLEKGIPKKMKDESLSQEDVITKKLYNDYSLFKRELHQNLVALNPTLDALLLFKKSQKLLDRFLFLFFAEDRNLLPPNSVRLILNDWRDLQDRDEEVPLYNRFKKYFEYLNTGFKGKRYDVFAYNGGLFKPDEILDNITIDNELLFKHTLKLSEYDFASEVDVNILGHIFENSLNELDEIKAQLEGQEIDKTKTKRKKDGVFYTPKYITKYIVDNTVGKLCGEKKTQLALQEEEYHNDKKRQKKTIQALADKLNEYRTWLLQLTICDPACGSGAFLNQALDFLINEHRYIDELQAKLFGDSMILSDVEKSILENNLFGVDLNEESVEIAKLSLWLRTAQPNRKLNDLNNNIKCGNSLIDDPAIAGEKAFHWQTQFPHIFEKDGFDVVIGNPPYVQLQSSKELSSSLEKLNYKTFEKTSDLYCIFYEKGNIILKEYGILGFITSNKWMRSNYGKSLRNYLLENTNLDFLIDLGAGIFESATVDSNILIFSKSKYSNNFKALDISKEKYFIDFNYYSQKIVDINPKIDDVWNISNALETTLKTKIENNGTILKDWDIRIFRGVLTGLNEAFIIDENKKNELIQKDIKSAELIVPVLRGRDINRYYHSYENLYLINVHNGYSNKERINIENYTAIKTHLDNFYPQLEKRGDKGATPYNLRNCVYVDDFYSTNIFYPDICQRLSFTLITNMFSNNTGYYLKTDNRYLLSLLNSTLINYYYKTISAQLGESGIRSFSIYIENIPIPKISNELEKPFIENADLILQLNKDLQETAQKFQRTIQRKFSIDELPKKLQDWYLLSYADFIKELGKKKIKLSLSDEAEWEDYFTTESQKALSIKNHITQTDKEIDAIVYELYGLTEEEIKIVEG